MRKSKSHLSDNLVTLNAKSFVLGNYQYESFFLGFERYNQFESLGGKISSELKKPVRDTLREYVIRIVPIIIGQLGGTPDILHLFVKISRG